MALFPGFSLAICLHNHHIIPPKNWEVDWETKLPYVRCTAVCMQKTLRTASFPNPQYSTCVHVLHQGSGNELPCSQTPPSSVLEATESWAGPGNEARNETTLTKQRKCSEYEHCIITLLYK